MPQLVKGGKYVFGWTLVNNGLKVRIPDETFEEYKLIETDKLIILSGSKSSGGFSIIAPNSIINSKLSNNIIRLVGYKKETNSFTIDKLEIIKQGDRMISWTSLDKERYFRLSIKLISILNIKIGDKLLVGRGSGLGPAYIAKGTIFQEALKHKDLLEYN
ncbi:MAG: hypothetical protein WC957_01395 [Candidatus Neomarinimicrobiota bacterium]|jgi:hypothetical protein